MTDTEKLHHELNEEILESEINDYQRDKERIRKILGKAGGVPQKRDRLVNYIFLFLVALAFAVALVVEGPKNIFGEIAILLVSLKLIYLVEQNARVNHFEFWMLSTLEWRLNEMSKTLDGLKKR